MRIDEAGEAYMERLRRLSLRNDVYITFSDVDKVGLYPKTGFSTPAGIYGYILTKGAYQDLMSRRGEMSKGRGQLSNFANERKYLHAYTVKPEFRTSEALIRIGPNGRSAQYDDARKERDIEQLMDVALTMKHGSWEPEGLHDNVARKVLASEVRKGQKEARVKTPFGEVWAVSRRIAKLVHDKQTVSWNVLLRKIGVNTVADYGASLIHPAEPFQSVVLNGATIQVLDTGYNPLLVTPKTSGEKRGKTYAATKALANLYDSLTRKYFARFGSRIKEWIRPTVDVDDKGRCYQVDFGWIDLTASSPPLGRARVKADAGRKAFDGLIKLHRVEFGGLSIDHEDCSTVIYPYGNTSDAHPNIHAEPADYASGTASRASADALTRGLKIDKQMQEHLGDVEEAISDRFWALIYGARDKPFYSPEVQEKARTYLTDAITRIGENIIENTTWYL